MPTCITQAQMPALQVAPIGGERKDLKFLKRNLSILSLSGWQIVHGLDGLGDRHLDNVHGYLLDNLDCVLGKEYYACASDLLREDATRETLIQPRSSLPSSRDREPMDPLMFVYDWTQHTSKDIVLAEYAPEGDSLSLKLRHRRLPHNKNIFQYRLYSMRKDVHTEVKMHFSKHGITFDGSSGSVYIPAV